MKSKTSNFLSGTFKGLLLLQLVCVIALSTSCGNQEKEKRDKELNELREYVRMHNDSADAFADRTWDELNSDYEKRKTELEKNIDKMDEETRKTYNQTVSDWETYKANYARKAQENSSVIKMDKLRATLLLNDTRPDHTNLAAKNVLNAYEHFIDVVKANKDNYSKEEWTVINVNYKALNGRKRELEKDLAANDKAKITKLQMEYTGIKAVNRPFADNE